MAYIVDGNNVMGQTPGWHRDKAAAQRRLLEQLARFAILRKTRITAVFDGCPNPVFPDGSAFHGVKIFYAAKGSDADTRIVQLVESLKDQRGYTVITSDRSLAFRVQARGARVMRSGEFRKQMESVNQAKPSLEDGEVYEIDDVNGWLRYFGFLPEDDR